MSQLLLIVLFLLVFGLVFLILKWPGSLSMTFSQHAAVTRWSRVYYALLFIITLLLLLWFFESWLVPQRHLPYAFSWFAFVAIIFQILCTFVPETGGMKTMIHRTLTAISALAMLPLVILMACGGNVSNLTRTVAWAALVIMLVVLAFGISHQKGFHYALLLQIGYYSAFFAVLLSAAYTS